MKQKKTRLVFLLNIAYRAVDRWLENEGGGASALSAAQAGTMFYLAENDGALTGDVAAALKLPAVASVEKKPRSAGRMARFMPSIVNLR